MTTLPSYRKSDKGTIVNRHDGGAPNHDIDLSVLLGHRLPERCFRALDLRWRLVPGLTLREIGMKLGVSGERAMQMECKAVRVLRRIIHLGHRVYHLEVDRANLASVPISELPLDIRVRSALRFLKVNTLGELVKLTPCQLLAVKNFGMTSLGRLREALAIFGYNHWGQCPTHGRSCATCPETGGKGR